ncbi:MAG: response regulator [Gemmataceae bacterium]|nr:response regulator [Gemmataceae bacterium]
MSDEKVDILIVDDLPEKHLVFQSVLEGLGQNVISVRSGEEALRLVLERDFAVILLDVNMPGMDGYETAAMIRKRRKSAHTPIIFITAYADEMHTTQGYALGAVDYLLSPIVPEVLRTKVGVFIDLYLMTQRVKRQADERVAFAEERAARAAAEDTALRLNFLAEASKVLSSSLEIDPTLQAFLKLVVPSQADLVAIAFTDDRGSLRRAEFVWKNDEGQLRSQAIESAEPLHPAFARQLQSALQTGKFASLDGIPLMPLAEGDMPAFASTLVFPMLAREQTIGAIAVAIRTPGALSNAANHALFEDLAGRAATALDNAKLYRDLQDADRRKNEFLSMLAHELRNPLAPIVNGVQLIRKLAPNVTELRRVEDMMDRQVRHLARIVDDLLDISRITRGKIRLQPAPVPIANVIGQAVEASRPLIESRRHALSMRLPEQKIYVNGDSVRLAQIFTNLLNNAAKYTNEGGSIAVCVETEGADVLFRIRDTGMGIPAEMLHSIFDLFTQAERTLDRSQGGLGIGLTLVRRLVEMHGGSVQAISKGLNQGSEFIVRLPTFVPAEPAPAEPAPSSAGPEPRRRILVVDDNTDAAESIAWLLRAAGHEVRTARDGNEAIASAEAFPPQVALLDIGLPGMDGYELARRLRKTLDPRNTLLIALTGYGQDRDIQRSKQAGFDHHLVKPADIRSLHALLGAH